MDPEAHNVTPSTPIVGCLLPPQALGGCVCQTFTYHYIQQVTECEKHIGSLIKVDRCYVTLQVSAMPPA